MIRILLACSCSMMLWGCGGSSTSSGGDRFDKPVPAATGAGTLVGIVTDVKTGARLAGVTVSFAGQTLTTDAGGQYAAANLAQGPIQVTFARDGYAPGYATATISAQAETTFTALKPQGSMQHYDATKAATLSETTEDGPYAVQLQPNTIDSADSSLQIAITPLDPTKELKVLPGSLATSSALLVPLTFAEFTILDSNGKRVNLKAGAEAIVELPIPSSLRGLPAYAMGSVIHCYAYDPVTGHWEDFVVGTVTASSVDKVTPVLRASVKHFSWYGGAPEGKKCVNVYGRVVSKLTGSPLANAKVVPQPGVNTYTDANGDFVATVSADPGQEPSFTAYQTLIDVDGSLSGIPGAKVIEYGEVPPLSLLNGLVTVDCSGKGDQSGVAGDPIQIVIGNIGTLNYQAFAIIANGVTSVTVQEINPATGEGGDPAMDAVVTMFDANNNPVPLMSIFGMAAISTTPVTPGQRYRVLIDADGNGSIDGQGAAFAVGALSAGSPAEGATVSASNLTVSWSDSAAGVSGYSPTYFVSLSNQGSTDFAQYVGTDRQFSPKSGVNADQPLKPGAYTLSIYAFDGPYQAGSSSYATTNNITGATVNGTFLSQSALTPEVHFTLAP